VKTFAWCAVTKMISQNRMTDMCFPKEVITARFVTTFPIVHCA